MIKIGREKVHRMGRREAFRAVIGGNDASLAAGACAAPCPAEFKTAAPG